MPTTTLRALLLLLLALACASVARASRTRLETAGGATIVLVVPEDGDVVIAVEDANGLRPNAPLSLRGLFQQLTTLSETVANLTAQLANVQSTAEGNAQAIGALQQALGGNASALERLQTQASNTTQALNLLTAVVTEKANASALATKADTTTVTELQQQLGLKLNASDLGALEARLRSLPATRVANTTEAADCTRDLIGGIRYDTEEESLDVCNGAVWVRSNIEPLGNVLNPGLSCAVIKAQGFSRGNGIYYLQNALDPSSGIAVRAYCRMEATDPVSLGGDGRSAPAAAVSCQTALDYFGGETGVYFVVASQGADAEALARVGTAQVLCEMEGSTARVRSFDGSASSLPAESCSVLKQFFTAAVGVYWVGSAPASSVQLLCDTDHPDGISLGGDGSSTELASASCASIKMHRNQTGLPAPSAVYFVQTAASTVVPNFCDMSGDGISLGGDGSTAQLASVSCAALKAHFNKPTAHGYFLEKDGNADNGNDAVRRACYMGRQGEDVGGDGLTLEAASRSCRHLFELGFTTSQTYWVNPSGSDAFGRHWRLDENPGLGQRQSRVHPHHQRHRKRFRRNFQPAVEAHRHPHQRGRHPGPVRHPCPRVSHCFYASQLDNLHPHIHALRRPGARLGVCRLGHALHLPAQRLPRLVLQIYFSCQLGYVRGRVCRKRLQPYVCGSQWRQDLL